MHGLKRSAWINPAVHTLLSTIFKYSQKHPTNGWCHSTKSTLPFVGTLLVIGFLIVAFAPAAPAAESGIEPVLNMWLGGGAKLTTVAPTSSAASPNVSLDTRAPFTGHQPNTDRVITKVLGTYAMPSDTTFTSAALVTLYLKVNVTTVINNVYVGIGFGGQTGEAYRGEYTDTNHTTPETNDMVLQANDVMKVEIAVPIHGLNTGTQADPAIGKLKAGQVISLQVAVSAVSQRKTPMELVVLYGSAKHPTRISAPVAALPTGVEATSQLRSYFLADNHAYATAVPTGTTAQKRSVESVGMVNGAPVTGAASALAPASGWSWGKQSLPTGLKANGDASISFWLGTDISNQPVVLTGLKAVVVFDPPTGPNIIRQQDIGLRKDVFTAADALVAYSLGLNMSGIDLPAGSAFELFFYTSTTSDNAAFKLHLYYGTPIRPSAIRFVVASGDSTGPASDDEDPVTDDEEVVDPPEDEVVDPVVPATPSTAAAGGNATVKGDAAFAKVKDIEAPANVPGIGGVALVAGVVVAVLLLRRRA